MMKLNKLTVKSVSITCLFALLLIFAGVAPLSAEVIVDSQGFELPNFSSTFSGTGALFGQAGQPLPVGTWLKDPGTGTAIVQTAVFAPGGGSQSVQVDRVTGVDTRWAVPVSGFPNPAGSSITIDWDMRVEQTDSDVFGPYFAVEAYDATNSTALLASLGVDATTGEVLYQATGTGFLTATNSVVSFGAWNHFQILLNYTTHEFTLFLNGAQVANAEFVDQSNVVGGLNNFTDAAIATVAAAGDPDSQGLTGTAYFDNFVVNGVPEPSSLTLAGCALVGMLRLRKSLRARKTALC